MKEESSNKKREVLWSNSYSMGIKIIDDQHKGLLDFVNDLFNHSTGKEDEERAYFKDVIQVVIDYAKKHFSTEETYMLMTKFQGYAEHKRAHDEFILTVAKSVKDFKSGKRLVLAKFAYFLKDWVLSHIAGMDVLYAQYFKQIASRKSDGKLSITATDIK